MSEATRDEPMTKYLVYKLAIKLDDLDMAAECLRCIAMSAGKRELLYACVLHARHVKQRMFVAQALKKLADLINRSNSDGLGEGAAGHPPVHTPALFRCTILMLRDIVDGACSGARGGARGSAESDDKNEKSSAGRDDSNSDNTGHMEQTIRDLTSVFKGGRSQGVKCSAETTTNTARLMPLHSHRCCRNRTRLPCPRQRPAVHDG